MEEQLLTLEASSPEELQTVIATLSGRNKRKCVYCALAIGDPEFLIYPFNFRNKAFPEIKKQITHEIAEIFSLPQSAIEYDFQIFVQEEIYLSGVCAAFPKKRLHEYLKILDDSKLVPVRIVPYSSAIIDYYFYQHKDPIGSFAVIDFSKKYLISLAAFKNDQCRLIRQIPYEFLHDVTSEIIDSLKNACVLSGIDHYDQIRFVGTIDDKMDIIHDIESNVQAKSERDQSIDIVTALSLEDHYFDLNLARRYVFSDLERIQAVNIMKILMVIFIIFIFSLAIKLLVQIKELEELNASYTLTHYDYAKNLKLEMDAL